VRKKEIVPEIKTTAKIKIRVPREGMPMISFIATAAPVLVLEIKYREIKEKPMTKVFVAPMRTKNTFLSARAIVLPITAAWPEPTPGRKLQIGEAIKEPKNAPAIGLGFIVEGFVISCFGILILFLILKTNIEPPKSPVKRGRSGWLISRFKTLQPKKPVRRKTPRAVNLFVSREIKIIETMINKKGIKSSMKL